MEKSGYQVRSVVKAMRVLDCLAAAGRPMTLQELSNQTGWPKSTVYGLLSAMRENAVVEQSAETGGYQLGIRLFEYGCRVKTGWDIVMQSRKYLQEISLRTDVTAFISMLDQGKAIMLDHCASTSAFRIVFVNGTHSPLHCTAQGKVLLAWQPPHERKRLMTEARLTPFTPHTITAPERLEAELAAVRRNGYAVEDGEYKIGLRAVAAPVHSWNGEVTHCLGLLGVFLCTQSEEFITARNLVVDAAERLSYAMGYRP